MSTVGIIVNPNAGKDIRRLVTPATHTSDGTKVGIVRRAIVAAFESGATKVLLMPDRHRLSEKAAEGIVGDIILVDEPLSGTRFDTIAAARRFWKEQVGAVIALGGDGTSRDVAIGWPDAPLIDVRLQDLPVRHGDVGEHHRLGDERVGSDQDLELARFEFLEDGVAFLAARVHHRLDDEFPELTDALLDLRHCSRQAEVECSLINVGLGKGCIAFAQLADCRCDCMNCGNFIR